ncbi:hypothetical protein VPH35_123944 [Triticum aestivum]
MKGPKSSSRMELGASLSIIEAEICNAAELGSGGQSGGFPPEAGVFQVCAEATSGWTMYFCQILNDVSVVLCDLLQQWLLYYLVSENSIVIKSFLLFLVIHTAQFCLLKLSY